MKLFMMVLISCESMYLCKRLVTFNFMEDLLQRLGISSSTFNWLSIVIPSSFTNMVISVILLSIFSELVWLFYPVFAKPLPETYLG